MAANPPSAQTPTSHESPVLLHQQSPATTAGSPERGSKRQKVTRACDSCKSRKRRCTGELPCTACHANGSRCTYLASYTRGRLVQPQAANHVENNSGMVWTAPVISHAPCDSSTLGTPYQPDSNARTSRAASPDGGSTFAGQYLGPTSPYTFLRRAWKRFEEDGTNIHTAPSEEPAQSGAIFTYGDRPAAHVPLDCFQLPRRETTAMLVQHYFDLAMPTYRFLHRATVCQWLEEFHQAEEGRRPESSQRSAGREAVVLMVLATARLFNADDRREKLDPDERSWNDSEHLFQMSQSKLQLETGRARLESVQARIGSCLYLLHTSRPNQAWFLFGTTVQLAFSLGLHRYDTSKSDAVARECRKRAFWACSTLDTYLSVIKGVPPLISLDEVNQRLPDAIDDENLTPSGIVSGQLRGDSVIKASIYHAQITRIVKQAAREQYSAERKKGSQKLETAARLNAETDAWHASLPVVFSGVIHPSSLIAIFRRQITVLQLAHAHAQMLINRPSLLVESSLTALRESQVYTCLAAAKSTLDTILAASFSIELFQAFWHTQFVSFNALSIIYVWLIQRKNGRLPPLVAASSSSSSALHEDELLHLAQTVQQHLVAATEANAPSLRYHIVLEEMQQEVRRVMAQSQQHPHAQQHRPLSSLSSQHPSSQLSEAHNPQQPRQQQQHGGGGGGGGDLIDAADVTVGVNRVLESVSAGTIDPLMETYAGVDFPLDPDLWLTLDSFPFSDFGHMG